MFSLSQALTISSCQKADAKLTDSRLYTGAHRHRFDEEGHGRGAEGSQLVVFYEGPRELFLTQVGSESHTNV